MVVAGLAVDVLLQTGQGAEGLDAAVFQIVLTLGDIAGVVGHRVGDVVAGHGGDAQDGDGARAVEVNGLLIPGSQAAVEVAGVAAVGGHLFHGDGHFLLGVGVVGHIGQQHQDLLALQGELLGHGQGHIGHQGALDDGVRGGVDEHHRAAHGAAPLQGVPEEEVVVILEAHAAQDDDVNLGLHGDPGQQLVVGLAGHREDGQLLALHQGVEEVDHGDAGADHVLGHNAAGGVHRRAADGDHVLGEGRAVVPGDAGAVKDPPQEVLAEGHHHGSSQKPHGVGGADALGAGEDLEGNLVVIELDDVGVAVAHQRQVAVAHALGAHGQHVSHNGFNFRIYFLHVSSPICTSNGAAQTALDR